MAAVSIVIPLYNKRDYIGRALRSVATQTFCDFEAIVVDDGSKDGGAEVVRSLADGQVRLIQQDNRGPGAARNRAVSESDSKYVTFLDADDELLPSFLARSVSNLEEHGDCDISICASLRGPDQLLYPPLGDIGKEGGPWRLSPNASPEDIHFACVAMHVSVVIRRDIFVRLGGFYEKGCTFAEDSYLWLQVLLNCRVYREVEPLMWYHTENAELNLHHAHAQRANWSELRRARSLSPVLMDPEPIRRNCPADYRSTLERYLAYAALSEALTRTSVKDPTTARRLISAYPGMKRFRYNYAKLALKLAYPRLMPLIARN